MHQPRAERVRDRPADLGDAAEDDDPAAGRTDRGDGVREAGVEDRKVVGDDARRQTPRARSASSALPLGLVGSACPPPRAPSGRRGSRPACRRGRAGTPVPRRRSRSSASRSLVDAGRREGAARRRSGRRRSRSCRRAPPPPRPPAAPRRRANRPRAGSRPGLAPPIRAEPAPGIADAARCRGKAADRAGVVRRRRRHAPRRAAGGRGSRRIARSTAPATVDHGHRGGGGGEDGAAATEGPGGARKGRSIQAQEAAPTASDRATQASERGRRRLAVRGSGRRR